MNQTTDHPVPFGMYTSGLLFDRSKLLWVLEKIAKFDILIISQSILLPNGISYVWARETSVDLIGAI